MTGAAAAEEAKEAERIEKGRKTARRADIMEESLPSARRAVRVRRTASAARWMSAIRGAERRCQL